MICPKCDKQMRGGAPHCETIKVQWECPCGNYETELYTPEEQKVNALLTRTQATFKECRETLTQIGFNTDLARAQN